MIYLSDKKILIHCLQKTVSNQFVIFAIKFHIDKSNPRKINFYSNNSSEFYFPIKFIRNFKPKLSYLHLSKPNMKVRLIKSLLNP